MKSDDHPLPPNATLKNMTSPSLKPSLVIAVLGTVLAAIGLLSTLAVHIGARITVDAIPHLVMKNDRTLELVAPEVIEGPRKQFVLQMVQFPINNHRALAKGYLLFAETQKEEAYFLCLMWSGAFVAFLTLAIGIARLHQQRLR